MKTVLITGVAGFIGSNLAQELLTRFPTYTIIGLDNLSSGRKKAVPKGVKFIEGSITDRTLVEKLFKKYKPNYVFHEAAIPRVLYSVEHPLETTDANILGTVVLLDASVKHGVERFIFASSSSVYGKNAHIPTKERENIPHPASPYALQKYTCEEFLRLYSELHKLDTVSLRYFNVFGPGQYGDSPYSTVISAWLFCIYGASKNKPFMTGDGTQAKDYNYIAHVVEANIQAMQAKQPLKGMALNISSGKQYSLWDIKKMIEQTTGKELLLERKPPRPGDVLFSNGNTALAKKVLGYKPTITFKEALKHTAEWVAKNLS